MEAVRKLNQFGKLYSYHPYPFQVAFHNARGGHTYTRPFEQVEGDLAEIKALVTGNQQGKCTTKDTLIDTPEGPRKMGGIWGKQISVLTPDGYKPVNKWVRKPAEECFRVTLQDGRWFESPRGHRVLTESGYVELGQIFAHLPESVASRPLSNSAFSQSVRALGVRYWLGTVRGWWGRCFADSRLRGGQLLSGADSVQVWLPSQDDVQRHSRVFGHLGVLAYKYASSLRSIFARLSSWYADCPIWGRYAPSLALGTSVVSLSCPHGSRNAWRSSDSGCHLLPSEEEWSHQSESLLASEYSLVGGNQIISVESVGFHTLYDLEVDGSAYIAGGVTHHNTYCGAKEIAIHATGIYPDWWDGWRFEQAPIILVCGVNNDKTRDLLQSELLGDPRDPESLGSGAIPKDCIVDTFRKAGIPDALDAVTIRHVNGTSKIQFQGYDAKIGSFMGSRIDLLWADEQMPEAVYYQFLRAVISTHGKIMMTFTPENGETETLYQLLHDLKQDQAVIRAGWDDAPHIANDPERMVKIAERWPAWQIPLRRDGEPLMGTGRVFSTPESEIWYDERKMESHWKRGCAVDYGMDHPFAAVWGAYDEDNDILWLYDAVRKSDMTLPEMASLVKKHGDLPTFYPHDMGKRESSSGKPYWQLFRAEGCWMYKQWTNPPGQGQREGQGGITKLPGIKHMEERFQRGGLRVAKHLKDWFEEYRNYHHKDGEIVDKRDDLMSATRYLVQSIRHFRSGERMKFTTEIKYDNRAIV